MPDINRVICDRILESEPSPSSQGHAFSLAQDLINAILEDLLKDSDIRKKISKGELKEEIRLFLFKLGIEGDQTRENVYQKTSQFIEYLKQTIEYKAAFIIPGIFSLPLGTTFGNFTIVNPSTDDAIKDHIISQLGDLERYYETFGWAELKFTTYRTARLNEILIKELERPLSIVSILMNAQIDPRDMIGAIYSPNGSITFIGNKKENFFNYSEELYGLGRAILSDISSKSNPSNLERKILRGIEIFGISQTTQNNDIRFIMLISALETILLTNDDKDYLGLKLAEKSAFLIEDEGPKRLKIYKLVKGLYGKRSKLVHEGNRDIEMRDLELLEDLIRVVISRLIGLSQTYSQMNEIEDLILRRKFYIV
jgi:hypothetical protein